MNNIKKIIESSDFLSGRIEGYMYYLIPIVFFIIMFLIDTIVYPFPENVTRSYGGTMMSLINFFNHNFSINTLVFIDSIIQWIFLILLYPIALGSWNRFNHILEYWKNDQTKLNSVDYRVKYISRTWAILLFFYSSVAILNRLF